MMMSAANIGKLDVAVPEVADILAAIELHRVHGFSLLGRWSCGRPNRLPVA
jgi:hypothetical protein